MGESGTTCRRFRPSRLGTRREQETGVRQASLYMLGAMGAKGLDNATFAEIRQAVQVGQAMASWTCGFDGARGGMYVVEKDGFQKASVVCSPARRN